MRWHRCLCVEERDSGVVGVGSGGGVCGRISSVSCGASRRQAHDSDKIRTRAPRVRICSLSCGAKRRRARELMMACLDRAADGGLVAAEAVGRGRRCVRP